MTEEEIRRLREALYVLQEQLLRNLLFDALKTGESERLNFFRVYSGALMDGIAVDWWKIFGNRKDAAHWCQLLPDEKHEEVRAEIQDAFAGLEPAEDREEVWHRVERFRNTSAAHLDYDEESRAELYPRLAPLRVSAEIIYRIIFEMLESIDRAGGFTHPDGMTGEFRIGELKHYTDMARVCREALKGFENSAIEQAVESNS